MNNPHTLNPVADMIINGLKQLGAFSGDNDIRMALEISGLVDESNIAMVAVVQDADGTVRITFDANEEEVDKLKAFQEHALDNGCMVDLVTPPNHFQFTRFTDAYTQPEDGETLMAVRLKAALKEKETKVEALNRIDEDLTTTIGAARAELEAMGIPGVEAVYPTEATGEPIDLGMVGEAASVFQGASEQKWPFYVPPVEGAQEAPAAFAGVPPDAAPTPEAAPSGDKDAQPEQPQAAAKPTQAEVEGLSLTTKLLIGGASIAAIGGAVYWGAKHFGVKLPFFNQEAANAPLAAVAAAFR